MNELRRQAANLIIDRLKTASVAKVASELRVSRQAIYDIQKGKYCPSLSLVQRACEEWKVKFTFSGITIGSESFEAKTRDAASAIQTDLFESLEQVDNRNFEIVQATPKPMDRALEITLRLTLPGRKTAGG